MFKEKISLNLLANLIFAFLLLLSFQTAPVFGQQNFPVLEPNKPIESEIKAGETQSYLIKLEKGQFLYSVVDLQNIDLDVKLFGADEQKLYEAGNLSGGLKIKTVFFVADNLGDYRLEITGRSGGKPQGNYTVRIAELRAANEQDRARVLGEKNFAEGELLHDVNKAESLRKAIEKYKQAVTYFRLSGERSRESAALTNLGLAFHLLGQRQDALTNFDEVLAIARATGDRQTEAKMLNNIGSIYDIIGQTQKALDALNQSLVIVRELKIAEGEASILHNIAGIYNRRGENEKALEYAEKSAAIHRETGNKNSEAGSLNAIGSIYEDLGESQKALDYYKQSLDNLRQTGNVRGQAATLNNIGSVYSKFGDKQRALDVYFQALAIVRESGHKVGEGNALNNIGSIYQDLNQNEKALEYFEQSLALRRAVNDPLGEAITLTDMGLIYNLAGNREKALDFYTKALEICRNIEARRQEAIILQRIGLIYVSLKEVEKGFEYLAQSLSINRKIADPYNQAEVLKNIAQVERDRANLEKARINIEETLKIVEIFRADVLSQELRASYLASKQSYYKLYIDILMQIHGQKPSDGYDAKALQVSEQARARGLIETLSESRAKIRQGVDLELLRRERELQKQINRKETQRAGLSNRKGVENQLKTVEAELNDLLGQYQEARAQIRASSPRYAELTEPQPLNLKETQKMLDSETMILEYSLGKEKSYVWEVTQDSMKSYELPEGEKIKSAARKVYELLISRNQVIENETPAQIEARLEKADKELQVALQNLSEMILKPISSQLNKKRLVIVAEDALQYVPFGALPIPTGKIADNKKSAAETYQPLIVEHEIINLPSASTLAVLRQKAAEQNKTLDSVAVIADPVFSKDDPRVAQSLARLKNKQQIQNGESNIKSDDFALLSLNRSAEDLGVNEFRRLRFSRQEADQITLLLPKTKSIKAVDFAADRELLIKEDLSKYQILHFATHGLLNDKNPELSGIVFSLVDERGNPKDGFLRLHEIYNMQIGADLAVLSACQTALGKDIKGEGLIGLTRGFMYAGAKSVVASLWKVEDRATAELMKKFYRALLKDKQSPAAALRAAQVGMLSEAQWKNPYYWAAFTLQGDWK